MNFKTGDRVVVLAEEKSGGPERVIFRYGYAGAIVDFEHFSKYGRTLGRIQVIFDQCCDFKRDNKWYCNITDLVHEDIYKSPLFKALE